MFAYLFLSNEATLTQTNSLSMCISVSQPDRNIDIAVFAGIAVFARLQRLNDITSEEGIYISVPYFHNLGVLGRFYGLNFKKMMVLENVPWSSLE